MVAREQDREGDRISLATQPSAQHQLSPHLSTGAAAQVFRLPPILRPCPDRGSDTGPSTLFRHPMPQRGIAYQPRVQTLGISPEKKPAF